jgi:glycine/D-amino acid oxidase-like deaminating enzyme
VLGAGLQGIALALELSRRGLRVDLYERQAQCLAEASLHNEGKIHLGYVYGHDETFHTARLMIAGALSFEPLLRRWLGSALDRVAVSSPFHYVVHRDSLITTDAFERHARRVSATVAEQARAHAMRYFERDPARMVERLGPSAVDGRYDPQSVAAVYATEEIGIDPAALAAVLRQRLAADPAIDCLTERTVVDAKQDGSACTVTAFSNGLRSIEAYDYVVNTLWTGRLAVDRRAGLADGHPWLFRFKYFVRATGAPIDLPSVTIVLGPFGDIVNYGAGHAYFSWYPAGMTCVSRAAVPPSLPFVLNGTEGTSLRDRITRGLATVLPSLGQLTLESSTVNGGWIFARGRTDIVDPASELHSRTAIGVTQAGRYLSIDTGKLTMAPYFAVAAADRIAPR